MNGIRNWLNQHCYAMHESVALYKNSYGITIFSCFVISVIASILFLFYTLYLNLNPYFLHLKTMPEISLFLKKEITLTEVKALEKQIALNVAYSKIEFIPKEESLAKLSDEVVIAEIQQILGENPLPDLIRVTLDMDAAKDLVDISAQLQKLPMVESLFYPGSVAQEIAFAFNGMRWGVMSLSAFLMLVIGLVSFNAIHLTQVRHKPRVQVSLWLGASPRFIRRIFYYQGLEIGFVVALLAVLMSVGLQQTLMYFTNSLSTLTGNNVILKIPKFNEWCYFFGANLLFLWLVSVLSARFFRMGRLARD